jgi:hypothetical protein
MKFLKIFLTLCISTAVIQCSQAEDEQTNTGDTPVDKAQFPNTKGTILGGWALDKSEFVDNVAVVTNFYVNRDKIAFERTCSSTQQILVVTGEAVARVTSTTVQISSTIKAIQQKANVTCGLEIQAAEIEYDMMGPDRLRVTDGAEQFTATRIPSGGGAIKGPRTLDHR